MKYYLFFKISSWIWYNMMVCRYCEICSLAEIVEDMWNCFKMSCLPPPAPKRQSRRGCCSAAAAALMHLLLLTAKYHMLPDFLCFNLMKRTQKVTNYIYYVKRLIPHILSSGLTRASDSKLIGNLKVYQVFVEGWGITFFKWCLN